MVNSRQFLEVRKGHILNFIRRYSNQNWRSVRQKFRIHSCSKLGIKQSLSPLNRALGPRRGMRRSKFKTLPTGKAVVQNCQSCLGKSGNIKNVFPSLSSHRTLAKNSLGQIRAIYLLKKSNITPSRKLPQHQRFKSITSPHVLKRYLSWFHAWMRKLVPQRPIKKLVVLVVRKGRFYRFKLRHRLL